MSYTQNFYPDYMDYPERVADILAFTATHMSGHPWIYRELPSVMRIAELVESGRAVGILGNFYKGQGHYVAVTGMHGKDFIIADPFGNFLTDYEDKGGYGIRVKASKIHELWSGAAIYEGRGIV
jgi:hypothetical protein